MAHFLILDANDIALNSVLLDIPDGGKLVAYEGPYYPGGKFDGKVVLDPNPTTGAAESEIQSL